MNRFQFNLGRRQSSLENASSSTPTKTRTNIFNTSTEDHNKIFHLRQPMNELQQNMRKIISFPQSTGENNKKKNRKNLMKSISKKFDKIGQEINNEFHTMMHPATKDVPPKEPTLGGKRKQHIDGDELIIKEIKMRATNISNTISKIRANGNANNFNSREKIRSLKHNMSERIKKGKETTRFKLNNMKISTILPNSVLKQQPPITINSSSMSTIISSGSNTNSSDNDNDSSSSSSSKEEIILLDTSIDFLSDDSYAINTLEKKSNRGDEEDDSSSNDDDYQPFTISDEEDELI